MSDTQKDAATPAAGTGGNFAPGAKSNPLTPEALIADYAAKIIEAGEPAVTSILDRGLWRAKADEKLPQGEQKKLVEQLPFDQSTFSRLVMIGKRRHDRLDAIKDQLMASYSTIYIIAKMEDEVFEEAMKVEGLISPRTKRNAIESWIWDRKAAKDAAKKAAEEAAANREAAIKKAGEEWLKTETAKAAEELAAKKADDEAAAAKKALEDAAKKAEEAANDELEDDEGDTAGAEDDQDAEDEAPTDEEKPDPELTDKVEPAPVAPQTRAVDDSPLLDFEMRTAATGVEQWKRRRPAFRRHVADRLVGDPDVLDDLLAAMVRNEDAMPMAINLMVGDSKMLDAILTAIVRHPDALDVAIAVMDEARAFAEAAE
jgi:hypothetical protein